jgi:arylsulfatase A-like enzyme
MLIAPGDEARGRVSTPPLLGSALRAAGWSTAAVLPLFPARPVLFAGIDAANAPGRRRAHPPAAEVLALGREALARLPAPRFVWLHLLDTHAPYLGGETRADYHRAARALDAALGAFLREQSPGAIVLLAADHGEAFGEHGAFTHQHTLYDEELRVPLVMCLPADLGAGGARVIDAPVGLVDVAPTLLELTGARAPYPRHGRSLLPALAGGAAPAGPGQPFETWLPRHHLQGLLDGCLKWMRDLDREWEALYDVCADPGETRDLGRARPDEAARLRSRFFEILDDDLDAYRSWR